MPVLVCRPSTSGRLSANIFAYTDQLIDCHRVLSHGAMEVSFKALTSTYKGARPLVLLRVRQWLNEQR